MTTASLVNTIPVGAAGTRAPAWWGMVLAVATEAALFAFLLFSYFYLGSISTAWPPVKQPELRLALPNTIILLLSSGTMWWSERGIRRASVHRLRLGLLATLLLGAIFLGIQWTEYRHQRFTPQTDAYGSLFFTITGFHGAHVVVGLLMVAVVEVRALLGHFAPGRMVAVSNVALYWHFVDAVWLLVFTSLYLSPRFLW